MYVLISLGVYAILVMLLRRPGIWLYLVATVVLGYLASLGVTDLVFHALHRGPEPWGGLDWTVGFFLFVILVAVGEDYNIFLMARVVEEEEKYGVTEGTRRAVAHTGGIISSCGLIMAGTFGSMIDRQAGVAPRARFRPGPWRPARHLLVRPILVPAFLVLIDRARERRRRRAEESRATHAASGASATTPSGPRRAESPSSEGEGAIAELLLTDRPARQVARSRNEEARGGLLNPSRASCLRIVTGSARTTGQAQASLPSVAVPSAPAPAPAPPARAAHPCWWR